MRPAVLLILIALLGTDVFPQAQKGSRTTNTWRKRAKVYEPLIASTAERYNVDPHLLWTIAYLESRFRHNAVSYKNGKPCAYGLMQFTGATALRYGLTNPHNPRESIDAAARYVRDLRTRFGPRIELILAAYNAGEGAVEAFRDGRTLVLPNGKIINPRGQRTGGIPPYAETRQYVARGGIIYRMLTRSVISQAAITVDKSSQDNDPHNTLNNSRQDSFYFSGPTRNSSPRPTTKPARSNKKNSTYVN
ncbi:MAG TPA: lytic transglycosylase domain-containing protein [Pyrinomonadaceae bacterium]